MTIAELIATYNNGEKSRDLELALVNHHDTPKEILEQLAGSNDLAIAEAASLHVNLAGEIKEGWYELGEKLISQKDLEQNDLLIYELLEFAPIPDYFINQWMPWKQIVKGIENLNVPVLWRDRLLSRLADIDDIDIHMWLASYEHTPIDILKRLAGDADVTVRTIISLQPFFSPEWFDSIQPQLEQNLEPLIYLDFFQWFDYPSTDITKSSVLKLAAKNNDVAIRKLAIQYGYACSDELFEILATDIEPNIRKGVASSWSANNFVREKLAQDEDEGVRKAVASCSLTPRYIRDRLAQDPSEEVRQAVVDNKYFNGEQKLVSYVEILKRVRDLSYSIKSFKITKNLDNSEELLERLAEDRSPETSEYRSELAEAIDTPTYILERLITSLEIKIRYRLAKRRDLRLNLSDKLWKELVIDPERDKIYDKRSRQHNGNNIPVNLAEEPEALPFLIRNYAESENKFSRLITLSSPLLLPYLFNKYIKSKSWLDRYALAQNPATPKNIRQILTKDVNKIVRAAAQCNGCILQSSSTKIIPKNKTDNHNLLATLTVLTKQAARDRLSNDWHWKSEEETILWEVENKKDLSFANFMIYHGILTKISLDKFIQGFQKQASRQCIRKQFHSPLIEPPITAESSDKCQMLHQWLYDNCETLETYQINFHKQENIFQIVIGKTKDGNLLGISPVIGYWTDHLHNTSSKAKDTKKIELKNKKINNSSIQSLESILVGLNPSIRFLGHVVDEFGRGTVYEIESSRICLIEKLLYSANFIEEIEAQINQFFSLYLTNFKTYKVGHWFSGTSYYHETYTIGETPQGDWLVLNRQIYAFP